MILFNLHNITDVAKAVEVAHVLVDDAIDAIHSQRGKSKKVRLTMAKISKLNAKCHAKGWPEPLTVLKDAFQQLETASTELDLQLWNIR